MCHLMPLSQRFVWKILLWVIWRVSLMGQSMGQKCFKSMILWQWVPWINYALREVILSFVFNVQLSLFPKVSRLTEDVDIIYMCTHGYDSWRMKRQNISRMCPYKEENRTPPPLSCAIPSMQWLRISRFLKSRYIIPLIEVNRGSHDFFFHSEFQADSHLTTADFACIS